MRTFNFVRFCIRPSPPHRLHGFFTIWPAPLQRGQVDATVKKPREWAT